MKHLLLALFATATLFVACKEDQDPACPTVDVELVPTVVKDSLAAHYPDVVVEVWYKVDALGFCARFSQPPNKVFAHFSPTGHFLGAEMKGANGEEIDGDNEQDDNDDEDCECR